MTAPSPTTVSAVPRVDHVILAVADLERAAARTGTTVVPGERHLPDGTTVAWRLAGVDTMLSEPPLPAFIAWDVPAEGHPSAMAVDHGVDPVGVAWVEVAGDSGRLGQWLGVDGGGAGGAEVRVVPGATPGLRAVGIALAGGAEAVLR